MILRIQTIMDHYGLSVSAFADEIGVQRSSISHLLNGRNKPSLDFVLKLVSAYPEVNLYWLLKGEGTFPEIAQIDMNFEKSSEKENVQIDVSPVQTGKLSQKEPERVVMLFKDGTFQSYNSKKD